MGSLRGSDAVVVLTALVFVIISLAADAPAVVFLAVAGWLVYFVFRNRRSDQRA